MDESNLDNGLCVRIELNYLSFSLEAISIALDNSKLQFRGILLRLKYKFGKKSRHSRTIKTISKLKTESTNCQLI